MVFAESLRHLWKTWDIRALILTSLIIQILLTSLAPLRKRSSNSFLMFSIWILYLSADAIAVLVIGLISNNGSDSPQKAELLAFWAPFLLLHLGGPDTITALALEDNELWRRHALQLATQVIITIYVFLQSFQHNNLILPTVLMFVDGFIKYFERTCALFFASSDSYRDSLVSKPEPGPNYARLMEEYYSAKSAHIPTDFEGENGPSGGVSKLFQGRRDGPDDESQCIGDNASSTIMDDKPVTNDDASTTIESRLEGGVVKETDDMIKEAHWFYEMSMPLLTDGFLSLKDRNVSRKFFLNRPCGEAFRIIQIELNLIYDIFYTKLFLFQKKRAYARVLCLFLALASLLVFYFQDRGKYTDHHVDVIVTFTLLGGAIALDLLTAVMFVLSDWWVILCSNGMFKNYLQSLMRTILRWSKWARQHNRRRWSNSISKYNLLRRCFRKPSSLFNLIYLFKIKEIRDILVGILYVKEDQIEEELIKYVIEGLQSKAKEADEMAVAKEVCSARGNLVLQKDYFLASECLSPWTVDVDYDESLLIWHLATDICYWTTSDDKDDAGSSESKDRRFSKALADYMAYIILRQQKMVSALVGMSETRFEHTCAEANKFMNNNCTNVSWLEDCWWKAKRFRFASSQDKKSPSEKEEAEFFKKFSEKVLQVKADVQPLKAKGDKSKSILFDACRLAKQLELFGEKQWEITAKVWVELLCYAAIRCSPRSHIARLSKGGELLTLVWLFMTHLGLGERFLQNQGFGWTKLIIHK